MRASLLVLPLLAILVLPPMSEAAAEPAPTFEEFVVPAATASEPTIGIPWNSDSVFYHANSKTYRARFDAAGKPTWADVTPPYQVPINLDPMLIADSDYGRIFAGGLHGPCSVMMLSDDDGATWTSSANMCSGSNFDHQSIGVGKPVGTVPKVDPYPNIAYYCAQGGVINCARSLDGGRTWGPFQETTGPCHGFHGHIRSSIKTGFVAVPVADCTEKHGFLSTIDGGLTWKSNQLPFKENWTNGFDPSVQFSRPSGWMYYAMASERGVHVAMSKDEGKTWETLGTGNGGAGDQWFDLGALYKPAILAGVFTNVQVGDDDRAAVAFFGLAKDPFVNETRMKTNDIYRCDGKQDLIWHPYVATTYDAGKTWNVTRLTDDPVQVGGIYDVVVSGGGNCRNLLDFNDMDIDSKGRIYWGIGDGCIDACATKQAANTTGWRQDAPRLWRQVSGKGLFAKYDGQAGAPSAAPPVDTGSASKVPHGAPTSTGSPSPGLVPALFVIALLAWAVSRRR